MLTKFEKNANGKKFEVKVFVEDAKIVLEVNGIKVMATAKKNMKHGWIYETRDQKLIKALGVKKRVIAFLHESAKEAFEEEKRQLEEKRADEKKKLNEEFQRLSDDEMVKLSWGTSYQHVWVPEKNVDDHPFFKQAVATMKQAKFNAEKIEEILGKKADDIDWGDYSITYFFQLTLGELKLLVKKAKAEVEKAEKEKEEKVAAQKEELEKKFAEAKQTGKKVEIRRWTESCNDPKEECDLDVVVEYAMSDGTTEFKRYHTW